MPLLLIALAALLLPFGLEKHNGAGALGVTAVILAIVLTVWSSPSKGKTRPKSTRIPDLPQEQPTQKEH